METRSEVESSGSNVEQAIAAGLEKLGVERDAVKIEVLDEGSRGLLGIGARDARVRLTLEIVSVSEDELPPAPVPVEVAEPVPAVEADLESADLESEDDQVDEAGELEKVDEAAPAVSELEHVTPIARQTLEELLEKMGIHARIEDYIKFPQDKDDYHKLVLNVRGEDLGVLIGRRGETLNALEYLTRLIVGREVERRVNLVVDVEGYRVRRERSLQQLAVRMAERVVATGRRQVLEPMSPAERRLVHVALRDHPEVTTESIGHGEKRKVTIFMRGSR